MERLKNKVAVITGGAGAIGFATAKLFARQGAKVQLVDINENQLRECASDIGDAATYVVADVRNEDQTHNYVKTAIDQYGQIDVAILNAGIEGPFKPLVSLSVEEYEEVMAVNVRGAWLGIKATVPKMIANGGGSIVITSSVVGLKGWACLGPYSMSKHALVGLMQCAALEYVGFGIRVNTVHPSPVETRMMRSAESKAAAFSEQMGNRTTPEELKRMIERHIPFNRYATPEEVAEVFLFLASDESKFITGSCYAIDGGMTGPQHFVNR